MMQTTIFQMVMEVLDDAVSVITNLVDAEGKEDYSVN